MSAPPAPDRLLAIVELIDLAHLDAADNLLCQVAQPSPGSTEDLELRLLPLGSDHPLDALDGWSAPADCSALVVRARGRCARILPDGTNEAPEAVAVTLAVGRDGSDATVLRSAGRARTVQGPAAGLLADACRRALGLATPVPPVSTAALWDALWLDRLLALAASQPGAPGSWAEAAALHPAAGRRPPATPAALAARCARRAASLGWGVLRQSSGDPCLGPARIDPDLAAWLDDGAFARRALAALPAVADLLDELALLLDPLLAAQVRSAATLTSADMIWN